MEVTRKNKISPEEANTIFQSFLSKHFQDKKKVSASEISDKIKILFETNELKNKYRKLFPSEKRNKELKNQEADKVTIDEKTIINFHDYCCEFNGGNKIKPNSMTRIPQTSTANLLRFLVNPEENTSLFSSHEEIKIDEFEKGKYKNHYFFTLEDELKQKSFTIYRAPCSAFIFGEYTATLGHPALIIALPIYIYVGIKETNKSEIECYHYEVDAKNSNHCKDLCRKYPNLKQTIQLLADGKRYEIHIWSDNLPRSGLGVSSAFSVCLAQHICNFDNETIVNEIASFSINKKLLKNKIYNILTSPKINRLFRTAWKIETCFHGFKGSGASLLAAILGSVKGVHPILFFSEARKMWWGAKGEYLWDLSYNIQNKKLELINCFQNIDDIKCLAYKLLGTQPGESRSYKNLHFAIINSGFPRDTIDLNNFSSVQSRYIEKNPDIIQKLCSELKIQISHDRLNYPLSKIVSKEYEKVLKKMLNPSPEKKSIGISEHNLVMSEFLITAYACSTFFGISSYISDGDDNFLNLMVACQNLLDNIVVFEGRSLSTSNDNNLAPSFLCSVISGIRSGKRQFGTKTSGAAYGGHLIVYSSIKDKDRFFNELQNAIFEAKSKFTLNKPKHFGDITFDTHQIEPFPQNYIAEGVKKIYPVSD